MTTHASLIRCLILIGISVAFVSTTSAQDVLPFPPTPSASKAGRTIAESTHKKRVEPKRLPDDAPNILIVLIDDVGPGQTDTFGGNIHTPTLSRIAKEGIAFNRFHSTAMCSPTRAALLTGRNHHRVGNGQITEYANDWDGYSGIIPKSSAVFVKDGVLNYEYNLFLIDRTKIQASKKLPAGRVKIEVVFHDGNPSSVGAAGCRTEGQRRRSWQRACTQNGPVDFFHSTMDSTSVRTSDHLYRKTTLIRPHSSSTARSIRSMRDMSNSNHGRVSTRK